MEEEEEQSTKWRFKGSEELIKASAFTVKGVVSMLSKNLSEDDNRPVISLGHGDPSVSRCFLTTPIAEDAIVEAVRSAQFNSYAPNVCILPARRGPFLTFLQIQQRTFFLKTLNILREAADFCYDRLEEIPCITCPHKAEGSMFVMVKLNLSLLEGINDDMEFCVKLAKEESVIVLPRVALGLKNWLRITFATEPSSLEDGLGRINAFRLRHAKKD
ncbi:Nicotianamine aminotransferase 1 [Camellia lanceoleosa]|uniref:Nicotianamine aminotransferase 1 n=1 Tax=Camellia lanceoleosa TaxID=1840588 RepID=A0ACC0H1D1_9ERIC|nr:Nicotianamine aminotransferase 1 [Camellia lanceoleosa]